MPLKIRVAETAGFCFGVQRALNRLLEIRSKSSEPIRTLGPLIHNEHVLDALKKRSIAELVSTEEVAGKHIVLRAHGVSPDTRAALKEKNARVCDATCPKVGQVQAIVKKYSRKNCPIVIIGDKGHAEVDGLLGYSNNMGIVVPGLSEAQELEGGECVCVVAQTTQDNKVFNQILEVIRSKFKQCYEFNTICDATFERQEESRTLAVQSDVMIIVGSQHSANTKRLADIAAEHCKTLMIQTADDLTTDVFGRAHYIGITAGASTPTWVIRDVVEKVNAIGWQTSGWFSKIGYAIVDKIVTTQILWTSGLTFLTLMLNYLMLNRFYPVTAFCFFLLFLSWRLFYKHRNPVIEGVIMGLLTALAVSPVLLSGVSTLLKIATMSFVAFQITYKIIFFDYLNVQADRISGLKTLPVIINEKSIRNIMIATVSIIAISAVAIMLSLTKLPSAGLLFAPAIDILLLKYIYRTQTWFNLKASLYLQSPIWVAATAVLFSLTIPFLF